MMQAASAARDGTRAWWAGDDETARAYLQQAVDADGSLWEAASILATVLAGLGRHNEALDVARAAYARHPNNRNVADRLAGLLLAACRWDEGWSVQAAALGGAADRLRIWTGTLPRWDGSPLDGRVLAAIPHPRCASTADMVLLYRYLSLIAGRVLVVAPPPLHRLLRRSGYEPIVPADVASTATCWALLSDLPPLLGGGPPPPSSYIKASGVVDAIVRSRRLLGDHQRTVGLCWRPDRADDATLPPSVRRGVPREQILAMVEAHHVVELDPRSDPAALADQLVRLDAIVTCDGLVANLAGALGLPSTVVLPPAADWRWGTGERSAWYPSLALLRRGGGT